MTVGGNNISLAVTTSSLATTTTNRMDKEKASLGSLSLNGDERSEIYVRPDGKKVRKKIITKVISSREDGSVGKDLNQHEEVYVRADGKKVRRVIKSASTPAVASSTPGQPSMQSSAVPARSNSVNGIVTREESEIIIRADGKKIRRIKKIKSRPSSSSSVSGSMSPDHQLQSQDLSERTASTAATSISNLISSSSSELQQRKRMPTAAATVAGDMVQPPKLGEIYINSDGKRVRRLFRQKSNASSDASVASSVANSVGEVYVNAEGKKVRRVIKSTASVGSVSSTPVILPKAQTIAEGEIYVRADGKRVRRVKRNASTLGASASIETTGATGKGNHNNTTTQVALDVAVTKESLTGFLANHSGKPNAKKMVTGAATVAGDHFVASLDGGEVYINAEGKKVRRVLKCTLSATVAPPPSSQPSLGKISQSILKERQTKTTATTPASTRDAASTASGEGEVYINAEGKKVRRVRRSSSSAQATTSNSGGGGGGGALANHLLGTAKASQPGASGSATVAGNKIQEGEIYIRADGKKVRRIRRPKHPTPTPNDDDGKTAPSSDSKTSLQGFLKATSSSNKEKNAKLGSATIARDHRDGEIVIRPDGKKVIRRYKSKESLESASGESSTKGEIYRRADGKLVRRVRRHAPSSSIITIDPTAEGADSRMSPPKQSSSPTSTDATKIDQPASTAMIVTPPTDMVVAAAGSTKSPPSSSAVAAAAAAAAALTAKEEEIADEYRKLQKMGLPNDAIRHKMVFNDVSPKIIAEVLGEQPRVADNAVATGTAVELTAEEDAIAVQYRKMMKMGLPDDAVRHKMMVNEVHPKIVASVLGVPWLEPSSPSKVSVVFTAEEETIAAEYRKLQKMGFPSDAIRHKMSINDVSPKIMAAVLGEPWTPETPATSAPAISPASTTTTTIILTPEEEETAGQFRKMKRLGLPDDAVRHKMVTSEVHPKIVAAVLGEPWSEPVTVIASTISLTEEEEAQASLFRKMKKLGLPDGAIRQKMTASNIPPKIIAAVLGDPWSENSVSPEHGVVLTEEQEAIASQYRKMKKLGLSDDAIRHKMTSNDVHPKIIAVVLGEEWKGGEFMESGEPSDLTADEETIAHQYRKLQTMGIPDDAVRHKMVMNEVDPRIIAAVFGEKSTVAPSTPSPTAALTADEEAVAAQYRKMRKMGLPIDAVRHKMIVNEVDPRIISAVLDNDAQSSSSDSAGHPNMEVAAVSPKAVAYVVVVGDEPSNDSPYQKGPVGISSVGVEEKFAVKVTDHSDAGSPTKTTKFFTLAELSRLSGQNQSELEAIVMEKRTRGASPPRFSLQPLQETKFEVVMPKEQIPTPQPPSTLGGRQMKEGEEIVNSELAQAARAVSALGDSDMKTLLEKISAGDMGELLKKLQEAEKRQAKLEKQLKQAGVAIAEDIDYMEAKMKIEQIAKRMNEIGGSDVTVADKEEQAKLREEYFKLEQEMERFNTALMITEEYQAEIERAERQWEADNEAANNEALKKLRRHMPVNIRHLSEAELTTTPSPNGKYLPISIAKKFKRTNILQCIRLNPDDLECMHPATLENMRVTGLTLTERRALYAHFKPIGPKWEKNKAEKMTERKWTWYQMMKNNFKEALAPYQRHIEQFGPPENHHCTSIGKQCPIKADKIIDYDGDYGWTTDAKYEVSEVRKADVEDSGAKAMAEARELAKEKKANERADQLKKHYKGKLLQVSKANGSCESMDEAMDHMEFNIMRWIEFVIEKGENESEADKKKEVANFTDALNEFKLKVLDFAQRSGMQMTGKKTAGGDKPDIRSSVEASLAEEVFECSIEFFGFITKRMREIGVKDTRVLKTTEMLVGILDELHGRNLALFQSLGTKRSERSRKLKKSADLKKEVEEKLKPKEENSPEDVPSPMGLQPGAGGGRGGLLDAIQGRGRGSSTGRGGLLDAIQGRGRGRDSGRGGLLDAIQGRGRGGRDGGRGGLLDAIQGRGRGGRAGSDGGRGGLMAAIQARGAGRGGGQGDGGRGSLLAAIAARGGGDN
jgi:hypothetical protein